MSTQLTEGWDIPGTAVKAHWFASGSQRAACGRKFHQTYRMLSGKFADNYTGARCARCNAQVLAKAKTE